MIVGICGWVLLNVFVKEVKPGVRDAVEDVMVDTAQLLAELAKDDLLHPGEARFAKSVEAYKRRPVKAAIWGFEKQTLDFRIYMTDAKGLVVYDSEHQAVGQDYSKWRAVLLTLRGDYGSRATRADPDDPSTSVMHVAAPVRDGEAIIGVVTVAKPTRTLEPIIARAEGAVRRQAFILIAATLLIGGLFTVWLTVSMGRLLRYAKALAAGQSAKPPSTGRDEIGELSRALLRMREELDGRAYVEHYVEHLTHEMKSPLAAIRGAVELLEDSELPAAEKRKFLGHVQGQSQRLQALVDKLLRLAQLEHQRELEAPQPVAVAELMAELEQACTVLANTRSVRLVFAVDAGLILRGDRFLLSLAMNNLLQNALDFAPAGSSVACSAKQGGEHIALSVQDQGSGLPDYAQARVFERFFSLPRPDGAPKSTGLGLSLVREIAQLHGGSITLVNTAPCGLLATLRLPVKGK